MATSPDEKACREYLAMRRWPNGPVCPRCNKSEFVYNIAKPWHWECSNKDCRKGNAYRFSLTAGTVFRYTRNARWISGSKFSGRSSRVRRAFLPFKFGGRTLTKHPRCAQLGICVIVCAQLSTILSSVNSSVSSKLMRPSSAGRKRTHIGASASIWALAESTPARSASSSHEPQGQGGMPDRRRHYRANTRRTCPQSR